MMPSGATSLRHVCCLHLKNGGAIRAVLPGQAALSDVCSLYSQKTGGLQVCFTSECVWDGGVRGRRGSKGEVVCCKGKFFIPTKHEATGRLLIYFILFFQKCVLLKYFHFDFGPIFLIPLLVDKGFLT